MKHLKKFEGFFDFLKKKSKKILNPEIEVKVGDEFIGKLKNEYRNKTIKITKQMLKDEEQLYHFLHYYGFKKK